MLRFSSRVFLAALLVMPGPGAAAELYKWVDENGVTNYANTPPPRAPGGKPPLVVEDRLSIYTPEKPLAEAMARRHRSGPDSAPIGWLREREPERRPAAAPAPPTLLEPCLAGDALRCPPALYDHSPLFHGRHRPVPLVQPQLPPGAIAGTITGPGAYIPGQSASAPPLPRSSPPQRERSVRAHEAERPGAGWGR